MIQPSISKSNGIEKHPLYLSKKDANFYNDDLKNRIKAINVKDFISRHVALKKQGSSWKGSCPFHNEKTPSFTVNEQKGTFKCFGCGEQGNIVSFIMKFQNKTYPEALEELGLKETQGHIEKLKANYEKVEETGGWKFKKKEFTHSELSFLGPKVTVEICTEYKFFSLDSYTTPKGHKYTSTPEYPMYIIDFGNWQKVYQPFSPEKAYRFMYINKENQPKDFIYGFDVAKESVKKQKEESNIDNEDNESIDSDERLDHIIKASGERDALNLASFGYNVIWLDSEAQFLSVKQYLEIKKLADTIYNLPDIDTAGRKYANDLNLKFLDIVTIWLPEELTTKKDSRGYPCKDFTDFVKTYAQATETGKLIAEYKFQKIISSSFSLKFIIKEETKNSSTLKIKNTRLYKFLSANGFYRYHPYPWDRSIEYILRIKQNIAEKIETTRILEDFIIEYMKVNYFDEHQKDAIFRSKQINEASFMRGLDSIEISEKYFGRDYQDVFFNNCHWRIKKHGITETPKNLYDKIIWENRIINKNVKKTTPLFTVDISSINKDLLEQHQNEKDPIKKSELGKMLEELPEIEKYDIEIHEKDFSLLKFLINTSNFHWAKQKAGEELTEAEEKEVKHHLINKLWTLGYLMSEIKEKSKPYAPILMDGDNSEIGEHRGGTGKSLTSKLPFLIKTNDFEQAVTNNVIDAQQKTINEDKFKMANTDVDLGYIIYNDCYLGFSFHQHLNEMDGSFTIRRMHQNPINIPYESSPKIAFTLNHAIKNDGSLSRRAVLSIFSDYYHAAGDKHSTEYNPRMEFGKNLLDDYNEEEWNLTYNLLANCISLYLKFPEKINPPMERANQRNIRMKVGETFYQWAIDKFIENTDTVTPNNEIMDIYVEKEKFYSEFELEVNLMSLAAWQKTKYSKGKFKKLLQDFCEFHGIIMNPTDVEGYESDRKRIRKMIGSKKVECFYFRAVNSGNESNKTNSKITNKDDYTENGIEMIKDDDVPF